MAHTLCFPFQWSAGLIPDKGDFYEESGEEAAWQRLSSWLASGQGELSQLFFIGGATLLLDAQLFFIGGASQPREF